MRAPYALTTLPAKGGNFLSDPFSYLEETTVKLSKVLAMLCVVAVLAQGFVIAQEPSHKSISQLREELQKLEAIAENPSTPAEVKAINQTFIAERRQRLSDLLRLRIDGLQKYNAIVGDTLTSDEKGVLTSSIRDLTNMLRQLEAGGSPTDYARVSAARPVEVASIGALPAYVGRAASSPVENVSAAGTGLLTTLDSATPRGGLSGDFARFEPAQVQQQQYQQQQTTKPSPTPKADVVVNAATEQFSGDKVRGPATIELRNLNVLRYDIRVGRDVTFSPGPDLKLPFIPPIPGQAEQTNPGGGTGGAVGISGINNCAAISNEFNAAVRRLNDIETEKARDVNREIGRVSGRVTRAKSDLEALVSASDSILATGGASAIIDNLTPLVGASSGGTGTVDDALSAQWPDDKIEELLGRLDILRNDFVALPTRFTNTACDFSTWIKVEPANKTAYEGALARITELQNQLGGLRNANASNATGTAFREAQNKLRLWRPILVGVRNGGVAGFSRRVPVGCGFAFDNNKETKVKLVKRDRLGEAGAAPVNEEIVTVVCSSPLSVSAGFGFSNVNEREFVFVPSTKTVTDANGQTSQTVISRFGFKNNSSFRTLPVILLNTRIWEPNDTIALHASTGAAVDIKTGQGGTDLEFIVGPSISFWRSFFVTSGLHIGRVPKLAGGFELNQEVPTGISEPPIEKTWKKGFVTTFTYKIR